MVARNQIAQMKQPATKIAGLVAEELHLIIKDALKKVWQSSKGQTLVLFVWVNGWKPHYVTFYWGVGFKVHHS